MLYTNIFDLYLYIYIYTCNIVDELTSHRQRHVMSNDVDFLKCPLMPLWPALLLVPDSLPDCLLLFDVDPRGYEEM